MLAAVERIQYSVQGCFNFPEGSIPLNCRFHIRRHLFLSLWYPYSITYPLPSKKKIKKDIKENINKI